MLLRSCQVAMAARSSGGSVEATRFKRASLTGQHADLGTRVRQVAHARGECIIDRKPHGHPGDGLRRPHRRHEQLVQMITQHHQVHVILRAAVTD